MPWDLTGTVLVSLFQLSWCRWSRHMYVHTYTVLYVACLCISLFCGPFPYFSSLNKPKHGLTFLIFLLLVWYLPSSQVWAAPKIAQSAHMFFLLATLHCPVSSKNNNADHQFVNNKSTAPWHTKQWGHMLNDAVCVHYTHQVCSHINVWYLPLQWTCMQRGTTLKMRSAGHPSHKKKRSILGMWFVTSWGSSQVRAMMKTRQK